MVLGAAPAYTNRPGSAASSYLIRAGGAAIVLDLGQGAFPNLASALEPSTLTAVLVSHLHPDHFIDLVPLRHYLRWEFAPARRVSVLGPEGLADRLDALDGSVGFTAASLDVEALSEGVLRCGPFDVQVRRVAHTEESFAFRVSPNRRAGGESPVWDNAEDGADRGADAGLVYSGDCGRADDLAPLIRPGDTLLSEASFGAGPVAAGAGHLTSAEAARVASDGGAVRLLLTHVLSSRSRTGALAAAEAVFSGPVRLVTESDRFEF